MLLKRRFCLLVVLAGMIAVDVCFERVFALEALGAVRAHDAGRRVRQQVPPHHPLLTKLLPADWTLGLGAARRTATQR